MPATPRLALIGAGAMGSNHARVIAESGTAELAVIIDTDATRGQALADPLGCSFLVDFEGARACDAALVAPPTRLHGEQSTVLLGLDTPLLVEKPLAPQIQESRALVDESRR